MIKISPNIGMPNWLEEIDEDKVYDETVQVPCNRCVHETRHTVLKGISVHGQTKDGDIDWWNDFQIVRCNGCDAVSFRYSHFNTEMWESDPETGETLSGVPDVQVYPKRLSGKARLLNMHHLPNKVRTIYEEIRLALCNEQPVLAGIGIRALVETVCKEKNAQGYNLEQRIDNLVAQGVLTADSAEILHSLRILGNNAAHEVEPHSHRTLLTAWDVVENLLKSVYILPKIAAKLPKRPTPA